MNKRFESIAIDKSTSIISALRRMDEQRVKLLLVLDEGLFFSLLSIGDIQRAIIANVSLETPILKILRSSVNVANIHDVKADVIANMRARRNDFMPIIDDENHVVDIIFWDDLFTNSNSNVKEQFDLPVVIMAGGQGSRLRPLTNVLPKPLIPIGKQTMMEDIMDRFVECGSHRFFISVNYKADFIKRYFEGVNKPQYSLIFFQEKKPLGTAGSLHLLKDSIKSTFFVSNCDIIIDEDYSRILRYHRQNGNEITVVAALKNYSIPYGTLETGENGSLLSLHEKPDVTFKINTGMYILEPHLIDEIPDDKMYHITFLIDKLIKTGRRVGVFPINEGSWTDIGNWEEYLKFVR